MIVPIALSARKQPETPETPEALLKEMGLMGTAVTMQRLLEIEATVNHWLRYRLETGANSGTLAQCSAQFDFANHTLALLVQSDRIEGLLDWYERTLVKEVER